VSIRWRILRSWFRCAVRLALGAAAGLPLGISTPAGAGDENYLPLVLGNRWNYALQGSDTEIVVVDRTSVLRGRSIFVLTHTVDGTPVEEDYWSEAEDDVFYHGYYRPIEDYGVLCDPPVKLIDAPLLPGGIWSTSTQLYILPDTSLAEATTFSFAVAGTKELQVPAGTFTTTAIEPLLLSGEQGTLRALEHGTLQGWERGTLTFPTRWVTSGIGTIRLGGSVPRSLESYAVVLAVEPTTWGSIKWQASTRRQAFR
jgi:hypothetical protein